MRRADIALWSRIPTGVDYIFTLPQLVIEARGQRVITRIDLPVVGRATLSHGSVGRADQSLRGQSRGAGRLPTVLSVLEFTVISWHYYLVFPPDTPHLIEVPNLPVAVDARGRSACYPRGSFYPLSPDPSTRGPRIT